MAMPKLEGSTPAASPRRQQDKVSSPASELVALGLESTTGVAGSAATAAASHQRSARRKEVPAGWFGGFSKEESTFDHDGVGDSEDFPEKEAAKVSEYGNTVNMEAQEDPFYAEPEGLPSDWFQESVSGGPRAAWRTEFPSVEDFHTDKLKVVPWLPDQGGRRQINTIPSKATSIARAMGMSMRKDAPWFDDSIKAYDAFGRNTPPSEDSDRFYWDWEEKSWTIPLTCKDPGCVANATLKTFDAKKLQHAKCRLTVGVHMTDFDDEYSREYVEWIIVNGVRISSRCDPMGKGCNASVAAKDRGLHPCVTDYPLDNFISENMTSLKIAGKISEMVDECPVDNNLLSGDARVTCYVKPHPTTKPLAPVIPGLVENHTCNSTTPLQCSERGCIANATLTMCRLPEKGQKCLLSVGIWQTDFDNDHGSVELVEFVAVNGKNVSTKINPGRNPCTEVYNGKAPTAPSLAAYRSGVATTEPGVGLDAQSAHLLEPVGWTIPDDPLTPTVGCRRRASLARSLLDGSSITSTQQEEPERRRLDITHLRAAPDEMKEIVTGQDVTEQVLRSNELYIDAKISKMVDECAKDGYLLNAQVFVECK